MADEIHPFWQLFGTLVAPEALQPAHAQAVADYVRSGGAPEITFVDARQREDGAIAALQLAIEVERPQDLAFPIRRSEPIAIFFGEPDDAPTVLALRPDFPATMHQGFTPKDAPPAMCIDDRPWPEARLTFTPADYLRRIQLWLARAARGELEDPAQPLEPLFFASPATIILPADVLTDESNTVELVGHLRDKDRFIIMTERAGENADADPAHFLVLPLRAAPQGMQRLEHAPKTLADLDQQLQACDLDLGAVLCERIIAWSVLGTNSVRRLETRLVLVVAFRVQSADGREANDLRAFVTHDTTGEVGVALGVLIKNSSDIERTYSYVRAVGAAPRSAPDLKVEPAHAHIAFDRALGAAISGQAGPDRRRAVLVGAGSLGSQLAVNLAREGRLCWTIVDQDSLLPHNLSRHALGREEVGLPKATGLARRMASLLREPVIPLAADVLKPPMALREQLEATLYRAEIVIDASASVAVSRHIADLPRPGARRFCVFFNPMGTALALLAEDSGGSITLRDLEAQYHGLVQADPALAEHLLAGASIRYSGSCRAATNRIPASRAALLSGLASQGFVDALATDAALVRVWTLGQDNSVRLSEQPGLPVTRIALGAWTVSYDRALVRRIAELRDEHLPIETGGVLLGIVDTSRHSIHLVTVLPAPRDSQGTSTSFLRGVEDLPEAVGRAAARSMHQIRYVGEWHSHPRGSSTWPSATDLEQLRRLAEELESDGVPALMAIAGDDSQLTVLLAGPELVERVEAVE